MCAAVAGGCDSFYQPLEVSWTVDGVKDQKLCATHGVRSWLVQLFDGDTLLDWTEVDCQPGEWISGEAFYAVEADSETSLTNTEVVVDAVDSTLSTRASLSHRVDLETDRGLLVLVTEINFGSGDFARP